MSYQAIAPLKNLGSLPKISRLLSFGGSERDVLAFIDREDAERSISRGMEFIGTQGYAREGLYEKYYRDFAVAKLVFGGVQLSYFSGCTAVYDLDFSSFGPRRLQPPNKGVHHWDKICQ